MIPTQEYPREQGIVSACPKTFNQNSYFFLKKKKKEKKRKEKEIKKAFNASFSLDPRRIWTAQST